VIVAATPAATVPRDVVARFAALVGERNCISNPAELRTYECDGLTSFKMTPGVVG
jgi:glycolate oxidase